MKTKQNKNILAVGVVLLVCLIVIGFSSSIQGGSYRVRPEIILPEIQTDTTRTIDAYERLMERFMSMTERNLTGINRDVKDIAKKLVLINYRLSELSTKIAGIEKALGIEQSETQAEKTCTPAAVAGSSKPVLRNQK